MGYSSPEMGVTHGLQLAHVVGKLGCCTHGNDHSSAPSCNTDGRLALSSSRQHFVDLDQEYNALRRQA